MNHDVFCLVISSTDYFPLNIVFGNMPQYITGIWLKGYNHTENKINKIK